MFGENNTLPQIASTLGRADSGRNAALSAQSRREDNGPEPRRLYKTLLADRRLFHYGTISAESCCTCSRSAIGVVVCIYLWPELVLSTGRC